MARLRILHIYKDYDPVFGGVENYIRQLALGHKALGHQVRVWVTGEGAIAPVDRDGSDAAGGSRGGYRGRSTSTTSEQDPTSTKGAIADRLGLGIQKEMRDGIEVWRASSLAKLASTPLSFRQVFGGEAWHPAPDIVHLHSPYPPGELAWLLRRKHPMVLTYHSDVVAPESPWQGIGTAPAPGFGALRPHSGHQPKLCKELPLSSSYQRPHRHRPTWRGPRSLSF